MPANTFSANTLSSNTLSSNTLLSKKLLSKKSFSARLLNWFDKHGRKDLPWQQNVSAYRVWISEIMLQQTQVNTVIPYYSRFLSTFPTIELLSAANEDAVLHLWTGLGYYARARNLHKTAKLLMRDFNGEFPMSVAELTDLPGIGRSTAGAIVSICSNQPAVILDGNVKRVIARCFAIDGWPGQTRVANQLWDKASELTPVKRVADYTQAIMDLGAMVCVRSKPNCGTCPFSSACVAYATNSIASYPGKKPKKQLPVKATQMLVVESTDGEILLQKRPPRGLWGGLWSFPQDSEPSTFLDSQHIEAISITQLPAFRHSFTHFHLDITPVHIRINREARIAEENPSQCWYSPAAPLEIGLSRPVTRILADLSQAQRSRDLFDGHA
jgi:A/G-specific adenine glycosylase